MTTPSLPELWASLRTSNPAETAGDFRMRLCHSVPDLRLFAAVAGTSRDAALVVEIPEHLKPRHLNAVSGRRLSLIAEALPGLPTGREAVVIRLRDPEFEDLFAQLGTELVAGVQNAASVSAAVQFIVRLIERWRRFLDQHHAALSEEEARGLIGELAVLERLAQRLDPTVALAAWKAPRGSIRDFECNDRTIEVKTFMTSAGASVRVNDPLQLEPEPGVPLFLVCQELARTQAPEFTLPGHVARVAHLFAHDLQLSEDYEDSIASAGYLPSHATLYSSSYALATTRTFLVREGFPRICPSAVPPGVLRVQFSLEILQLSQFEVDADVHVGIRPSQVTLTL